MPTLCDALELQARFSSRANANIVAAGWRTSAADESQAPPSDTAPSSKKKQKTNSQGLDERAAEGCESEGWASQAYFETARGGYFAAMSCSQTSHFLSHGGMSKRLP